MFKSGENKQITPAVIIIIIIFLFNHENYLFPTDLPNHNKNTNYYKLIFIWM
jgi:hypothetical protein